MTKLNLILKYTLLAIIGGEIYCSLEVLYRGYSHWSMFVLGGVCFIALGLINEIFDWETPLLVQMLIGSGIITALEFITGCIVNIGLGWNVWDYSEKLFNIAGQISLGSSAVWFLLSAVGIILDDWIRYAFFDEEIPRYKII